MPSEVKYTLSHTHTHGNVYMCICLHVYLRERTRVHAHAFKTNDRHQVCVTAYLVDRAQREPTATAYLAPPQPTYLKATGRGLLLSSK